MTAFDVVGIGENSVDLVYRLPGAVAPNAKLPISGSRVSYGGQVATTLATCAAFGLRPAYVGSFGDDEHGRMIREALAARQIDVSHAVVRHAPNRSAVILVDERTGDRTVLWQRDPRLALDAAAIPRELVRRARLLHVDDLDEQAATAAATFAREADVPVTGDIDRVTPGTARLVATLTAPILAAHVLSALTGEADPERGLRTLRHDHRGWLTVTLGTTGAMLLEGDRLHHVPAFPIDALDTTGAGDVFRGAFITAMLRGDAAADVLRFAAAAAAVSCTREGALDSVPTLDEVEAMLSRT